MKKILILSVLAIIFWSCKNEVEPPKVIYDGNAKAKTKKIADDTTKIDVADLPVQFEGTNVLLFPVGKMLVNSGGSSIQKTEVTEDVSFRISNNNDNEITGFLNNVKFQSINKDTITTLTDKKVIIQSITYLKDFAVKTKKQFLVYVMEDADTNKDDTIDLNDINTLYISDISGSNFKKISTDFQELIDWQLVLSLNRLYFRTIEDTNKNGKFDKADKINYQYLNLLSPEFAIQEYRPL